MLIFQVLWRQFLKFKETELPAKEADKNRSKHIYKSFEVCIMQHAVGLIKEHILLDPANLYVSVYSALHKCSPPLELLCMI